ncbi:AAA family ATPase [Ktedonobacteria bacterium brp13]|nr:AAA family ATPase [Ktedonobacteria bacterium brp13]
MTEQDEGNPLRFVATKNSRRFGEMCDACWQARVVGLGYGPPGTGKTESAKQYAQWNLFKPYLPEWGEMREAVTRGKVASGQAFFVSL